MARHHDFLHAIVVMDIEALERLTDDAAVAGNDDKAEKGLHGFGKGLETRRDRRISPALERFTVVDARSEEHTSELQSLMRTSYAVFCLKKKNKKTTHYY